MSRAEVNLIIVLWKDEWVCECFHVFSCDQTADERGEMLGVGDTAEVCHTLPNSFSAPPIFDSLFSEIPLLL